MTVVTEGSGMTPEIGAGKGSTVLRRALSLPRPSQALSVLLPLAAPAMIVAYLIGAYNPQPGLVRHLLP